MGTSLSTTFAALADDTRRALLSRLAAGDMTISDLATPHYMTLTGVMKHLRVLEGAGLITRKKHGRTVWCGLRAEPLKQASKWVARYQLFWEQQLDALGTYLEQRNTKEALPCPRRKRSRRSV